MEAREELPNSLWGFLWKLIRAGFDPKSPKKLVVEFSLWSVVLSLLVVVVIMLFYLDTNLRESLSMIREIPRIMKEVDSLRKDVDEIKTILTKHGLVFMDGPKQIGGDVYNTF